MNDWRKGSGEYPSERSLALAKASAELPPPRPRDINRARAERVTAYFLQACAWWVRENESSWTRLAEAMGMSEPYLIDLKQGKRPVLLWMLDALPADAYNVFDNLLRHSKAFRAVSNAY